jgi:hypothetical protein
MDVAKWWMETSKQEGLSDADAKQVAYRKMVEYQKGIEQGLSPYQYKSETLNDVDRTRIAYMKSQMAAQQQQPTSFLYELASGRVAPTTKGQFIPELGVAEATYALPSTHTGVISDLVGIKIDGKGMGSAADAVTRNNFYIGNQKLDLNGLSPDMVKAVVPTGNIIEQVDATTGERKFAVQYKITLNEPGFEMAKYAGKPIRGFMALKTQQIPGAVEGGSNWGFDKEQMQFLVTAPLDINNQNIFS